MQAIFEFLAGLVAALTAAALAHLGFDVERSAPERPEIHRTVDCAESPAAAAFASESSRDC